MAAARNQVRVAINRIRSAIKATDQIANHPQQLQEVSLQLLDALDRLKSAAISKCDFGRRLLLNVGTRWNAVNGRVGSLQQWSTAMSTVPRPRLPKSGADLCVYGSTGGVRKQRSRWIDLWYESGEESKVLGSVKDVIKGDAREAVANIVATERARHEATMLRSLMSSLKAFIPVLRQEVEGIDARKQCEQNFSASWQAFRNRELSGFQRDEFQDLLDRKAKQEASSFSVVDYLRWDLKQIFGMAVADGHIRLDPALLLFTHKEAKKPIRRAMAEEGYKHVLPLSINGTFDCETRDTSWDAPRAKSSKRSGSWRLVPAMMLGCSLRSG